MAVTHFGALRFPNLAQTFIPPGGVTHYTGARMKRRDRSFCAVSAENPIYEPLWVHTRLSSGQPTYALEIGTAHFGRAHLDAYGTCVFHYGVVFDYTGSVSWLFSIPVRKYGSHLFQIAMETAVQWVWRIDGKPMATWQRDGARGIRVELGLEVYSPNVPVPCNKASSIVLRDQDGRWRPSKEFSTSIYNSGAPSMYAKFDTARQEFTTAFSLSRNPSC